MKFVIGDIHGNYKGLRQCLERSGFDKATDTLISLGDVADGYPQVKECFDELLTIRKLVFLMSNHDQWFLEWLDDREIMWSSQGGQHTFESYIPIEHYNMLKNAQAYHIDGNRLFVHGGIDPEKPMEEQSARVLFWDRNLVASAKLNRVRGEKIGYKFGNFDEIYVGHTSTTYTVDTDKPTKLCNVWMMDTGGGWDGRLSIMNVDTHEFWQADKSSDLYPGVKPR